MRPVTLPIVLAASLFAAAASAAPPDCQARIDRLLAQAASIQNERLRQLFDFDLKRAASELSDGDETECLQALDHAASLLQMK